MIKKGIIFILALVAVFTMGGLALADNSKKVEICHFPPGNVENPQLLSVSPNSLDAHYKHGDYVIVDLPPYNICGGVVIIITPEVTAIPTQEIPVEPTEEPISFVEKLFLPLIPADCQIGGFPYCAGRP